MLFLLPLTIFISQGLVGSAYVVVDENGYYSTWRSSSVRPQLSQWPEVLAPQPYVPFWQNFNPFNWMRPQPTTQQDTRELKTLRNRQLVIFNILRCMLEENDKEACKKILRNADTLFEEYNQIMGTGTTEVNKPVVIQSTIWQIKPLEIAAAVSQVKPPEVETPPVQEKPVVPLHSRATPVEIELPALEKPDGVPPAPVEKPVEVELPPVPVAKPMELSALQEKPASDVVPPALVEKPVEVEQEKPAPDVVPPTPVENPVVVELPIMQERPVEVAASVQPDPVEKVGPAIIQEKPLEAEAVVLEAKTVDVPQN